MCAIPSSGEEIPAVGLGSARTFSVGPSDEERAPLREVLRRFYEAGGRFFDTAPSYGSSERVAGQLVQELGIQGDLFFATKISTGGGREAGLNQQKESLQNWGRDTIDLNQVHNLRDVDIHLKTIRQAKEESRARYVGVTTSFARQYQQMERVLGTEKLDFVQINYSLGERQPVRAPASPGAGPGTRGCGQRAVQRRPAVWRGCAAGRFRTGRPSSIAEAGASSSSNTSWRTRP